jgi:5-hydroxyisourate hydrolase-like protein (transthyretin family)
VTPCPARTRAAITWDGPAGALTIHDRAGRVVRTFGRNSSGRIDWDLTADDGRRLGPGVYFCRFSAGDYRTTEKLVVQR